MSTDNTLLLKSPEKNLSTVSKGGRQNCKAFQKLINRFLSQRKTPSKRSNTAITMFKTPDVSQSLFVVLFESFCFRRDSYSTLSSPEFFLFYDSIPHLTCLFVNVIMQVYLILGFFSEKALTPKDRPFL